MAISLSWHHPHYSDDDINTPIDRILSENIMMAMSSVSMHDKTPRSWINSIYFAYADDLTFYILTYPTSEHIRNITVNPSVALAIASPQVPDQYKVGLQIAGTCTAVKNSEIVRATAIYATRFPWLGDFIRDIADWETTTLVSRLYKITPQRIKMFTERQIGTEMWIDLRL